jgi:hypothetical protein
MSIERYLSVQILKWRTDYFKSKHAIIVSLTMGLILATINLSFVLNIHYDTEKTNITCFLDDVFSAIMIVSYF